MKKTLLTYTVIFAAFTSFAQNFTQANEPTIGDAKSMFICDSFANNYAATTGSGVTWDYSTLASYVGQNKTMDAVDPATTAFASDFPVSTKAIDIQSFSTNFFNSSISERVADGYVLKTVEIGDIKAKFTSNAQLLMNYPSTIGTTVVDSFAGSLSFTYSGIPQNPTCTGISYASYDGYGTFIQPDGTTLTNVSRYHFVDTLWTTVPFIGAAEIIRSQYEYYDLAATNKLPIFLHVSAKLVSSFPDPLVDGTVVLSDVAGVMTASLDETNASLFKIYPNPASNQLFIQDLPADAKVSLRDLSGRMVQLKSTTGNSFDIREMAKGTYLMTIETDQISETKSIVIE